MRWILEADSESFFDSVALTTLMVVLRKQTPDRALLRLVGKCLRADVLDGSEYSEREGRPELSRRCGTPRCGLAGYDSVEELPAQKWVSANFGIKACP